MCTERTSNRSLVWLHEKFEDRVISRRCEFEWSPHSPGLNPPDLYLWGTMKDRVYENDPKSLAELKAAIVNQIRRIPADEIGRVVDNFAKRVRLCVKRGGANMEHVL